MEPSKSEQYRRVFWLIYVLDIDIMSRTGSSPSVGGESIAIGLPSETHSGSLDPYSMPAEQGTVNVLRYLASLAIIQSKVYMTLDAQRIKFVEDEQLQGIEDTLLTQLEVWKSSFPVQIQPISDGTSETVNMDLHVLWAHLNYYTTLCQIHSRLYRIRHERNSGQSENQYVRAANPQSHLEAARSILRLVCNMKHRQFTIIWLVHGSGQGIWRCLQAIQVLNTAPEQRLALVICDFLKASFNDNIVTAGGRESMTVATICIAKSFNVNVPNPLVMGLQKRVPSAAGSTLALEFTEQQKKESEVSKLKGNTVKAQKDYGSAIDFYTQALTIDAKNAIFLSNRASAPSSNRSQFSACADTDAALVTDPTYIRGSRLSPASFNSGEPRERLLVLYCRLNDLETLQA
ncbi:hypothetical protein FOXYS1_9295 [Fusarium oxysporum]|uniref:SGTA homodimerisation domain-containing protein n=1 Tax=Fusarium oxysporum TaxID=5507 RepID=A0A8H5A7I4_FUSOX|nr:hypothetical protein FOXYS1_9295 [Fusarium oxysporum]